jgi:hypothetical protein
MQAADLLKAQVKKALQEVLPTHVVKEHLPRANFQTNLLIKNAPHALAMRVVKKDPEEVHLPEAHHALKEEVKDLTIKEKLAEDLSAMAADHLIAMQNPEEVFLKDLNAMMMSDQDVHPDQMANVLLSVNAAILLKNLSEANLITLLHVNANSTGTKILREEVAMIGKDEMTQKDQHAEVFRKMNQRTVLTILSRVNVLQRMTSGQ